MKIGVLNGELNHWQAGIAFGNAPVWQHQRYWFIHVWCIKLDALPPMGEMIRPEQYRGVRFYKQLNYPNLILTIRTIRIGTLTFQVPIKIQFS